jgi:hypothetical protein
LVALWQIIRLKLLKNVSLAAHPELALLASDNGNTAYRRASEWHDPY